MLNALGFAGYTVSEEFPQRKPLSAATYHKSSRRQYAHRCMWLCSTTLLNNQQWAWLDPLATVCWPVVLKSLPSCLFPHSPCDLRPISITVHQETSHQPGKTVPCPGKALGAVRSFWIHTTAILLWPSREIITAYSSIFLAFLFHLFVKTEVFKLGFYETSFYLGFCKICLRVIPTWFPDLGMYVMERNGGREVGWCMG